MVYGRRFPTEFDEITGAAGDNLLVYDSSGNATGRVDWADLPFGEVADDPFDTSDAVGAITPSTLEQRIPAVDPRSYGATLDGSTDDLAALDAMTSDLSPGVTVDFGGRTAYVSAPWTMDVAQVTLSNGGIEADDYRSLHVDALSVTLDNFTATRGTGLGGATTAAQMSNIHASSTSDGFTIRGGVYTDAFQAVIYLDDGLHDATIDGATVSNSNSYQDSSCIYAAAGSTGHQRIAVQNCKVTSTGCANGVAMYDCSDSTVRDCVVSGATRIADVTLTGWSNVSGNIYSTADTALGQTRVILNNGTQVTENTSTPTTPGSNQWGVSGETVYINLGGTNPSTRTITSKIVSGYGIYYYSTEKPLRGNKVIDCVVTDCDGFGIYYTSPERDSTAPIENLIDGCTLRNVCIDGIQDTSLPFGGIGIALRDAGSITISDTDINGVGTAVTGLASGVRVNNVGTGTAIVKLSNVTVRDATANGFHLSESDIVAENCTAMASGSDGFFVTTTTASTMRTEFKGCRVLTTGSHGVETSRFAGSTLRLTWLGGEVADAGLRGMFMSEVTGLKIDGATVRNWAAAQQGILLSGTAGCVDAVVTNCELEHGTNSATAINVSAASTGATIRGNKPSSNLTTPYVFNVATADHDRKATTATSTSTLTVNSSVTERATLSAQATNLTIAAPTGSPSDGQLLVVAIKDNGTSRTLTWNAAFVIIGTTLPAATTISKWVYVTARYSSAASAWHVLDVKQEA